MISGMATQNVRTGGRPPNSPPPSPPLPSPPPCQNYRRRTDLSFEADADAAYRQVAGDDAVSVPSVGDTSISSVRFLKDDVSGVYSCVSVQSSMAVRYGSMALFDTCMRFLVGACVVCRPRSSRKWGGWGGERWLCIETGGGRPLCVVLVVGYTTRPWRCDMQWQGGPELVFWCRVPITSPPRPSTPAFPRGDLSMMRGICPMCRSAIAQATQ